MVSCARGAGHGRVETRSNARKPIPRQSQCEIISEMSRDDTPESSLDLEDDTERFLFAFNMQLQILKKKKLREEGKAAVYVEQNHRPQILYTEDDREIMEHAWELTAAHREDLAGQQGNPQGAPVLPDQASRPNVMDMLQRSGC